MSNFLCRRDFIKLAGIGTVSMAIGESEKTMLGASTGRGYSGESSGQAGQAWT